MDSFTRFKQHLKSLIASTHRDDKINLGKDVFINTLAGKKLIKINDIVKYISSHKESCSTVTILDGAGINDPIFIRGLGHCSIGKYSSIGQEIKIITSNHTMNYVNLQLTLQNNIGCSSIAGKAEEVIIGHATWIGDRVTFLPGSSVGNGSIVGAASVVTKKFPPYQIIAGNPAKIIRPRFSQIII